LLLNDFTAIRQ